MIRALILAALALASCKDDSQLVWRCANGDRITVSQGRTWFTDYRGRIELRPGTPYRDVCHD